MPDWLISSPAWGARCVPHFVNATLPAIRKAAERVNGRVRLMVNTDNPEAISGAAGDSFELILRGPPEGHELPHIGLGNANRDAIREARTGEAIAWINADMVPSVEVFAAAEARFAEGKRLVMCMGTRTTATEYPPIGASARALLGWAWDNRHHWIENCIFGKGRTTTPSVIYFDDGDSVVMHGFHLHQFAALKTDDFTFDGVTGDWDMAAAFPRELIHVVTSADELAFAEMSPASYQVAGLGPVLDVDVIAKWAANPQHTIPAHHWQFTHRVSIVGHGGDIGDGEICARILAEACLGLDRFGSGMGAAVP